MGLVDHGLCRACLAAMATVATTHGGGLMHPLLVFALAAAATWDSWRWYFGRIAAAPEEAATLVLTVAFLGLVGASRLARPAPPRTFPVLAIASLLAVLAATHAVLPPIIRAAAAVALALFCLYVAMFKERPPVAYWGLVALAL